MASSIVFTDNGATTIIEWSDGQAQTFSAPKGVSTYSRTDDFFRIISGENQNVTGQFRNSDLTTPYADADALEVALQGFFSGGAVTRSFKVTAAQLANAATFGTLPGIELFTMPDGTYPVGTVEIQSFYGTAQFTLASDLTIRINDGSPQLIVARFNANTINGASVDRACPVHLGSASGATATQSMTYGATFYLSSGSGSNVATVGDGYIVVIFEYITKRKRPM